MPRVSKKQADEMDVEVRDGSPVWIENDWSHQTTNNRMEMRAMMAALRRVPEGGSAVIYSDSILCVRTLNEWAEGWAARGWKRSGDKPVENVDLVREALELRRKRPDVTIEWIRGHDGFLWNEFADKMATDMSTEAKRSYSSSKLRQ